MPLKEEIEALRREIVSLLRQQMEALDSPLGLTDTCLTECYQRQDRVQELREKLQTLSGSSRVVPVECETSEPEATASCAAQPRMAA